MQRPPPPTELATDRPHSPARSLFQLLSSPAVHPPALCCWRSSVPALHQHCTLRKVPTLMLIGGQPRYDALLLASLLRKFTTSVDAIARCDFRNLACPGERSNWLYVMVMSSSSLFFFLRVVGIFSSLRTGPASIHTGSSLVRALENQASWEGESGRNWTRQLVNPCSYGGSLP